MDIEFDPDKDAINVAKHGVSLRDFGGFDDVPSVSKDERLDYGELRYRAFGRIAGNGYCLVFTWRGSVMRLVSFRRAHEKEMRRYEQRR